MYCFALVLLLWVVSIHDDCWAIKQPCLLNFFMYNYVWCAECLSCRLFREAWTVSLLIIVNAILCRMVMRDSRRTLVSSPINCEHLSDSVWVCWRVICQSQYQHAQENSFHDTTTSPTQITNYLLQLVIYLYVYLLGAKGKTSIQYILFFPVCNTILNHGIFWFNSIILEFVFQIYNVAWVFVLLIFLILLYFNE